MLSPSQIEWMERNNKLFWCRQKIRRVDNREFQLKDFPFLKPIYQDKSKRIAVEKSEQLGMTIYATADSFFNTCNGLNWIYFFPTAKLVTKYVQGRYDVLISNNPELSKLIAATDNTTIKKIGSGVINFSGLGSSTAEGGKFDLVSTPADGVTFDEVEKMHPAKVTDALGRISRSPFQYERYLSTPGLPNYGIDGHFMQSDLKYWHIKCLHCGNWNVYDDVSGERPMGAFPECIEQGFLCCNKCRKRVDTVKGPFEFVPKAPEIKDFSGFHLSQLYYPLLNCKRLLTTFHALQSTTDIKNFVNNRLGLPFVDNSQRMTKEDVLHLCTKNAMRSTETDCFMGLDVGGTAKGCHYAIGKRGKETVLDIVNVGIIKGNPMGSDDDVDFLFRNINLLIGAFNIRKFCVDARPEERISRAVINKFRAKGWRVIYNDNQKGSYDWDQETKTVQVNRTESLDNSHYLLQKRMITLPRQCPEVEEFATHCENLIRDQIEDERTGERKFFWKRIGPDDYRHAFNYLAMCVYEGQASYQKPAASNFVPDKLREELGI